MWNLPPPPGFQGFRDDLPLTTYTRNLPHWRQDGATYFVTYRLNDSLPQAKLEELRLFKAEWERQHPPPRTADDCDELARETMRRVESWLDQGMGECLLSDRRVADLVVEDLHHFDGDRYELGCFVVMPNHVHAIVRPLMPAVCSLERVLQTWKGFTSRKINRLLERTGRRWQEEAFDRIIRDEEHLWRVIQYIGNNPFKAGLRPEEYRLWIRPSWVALGWQFEAGDPPKSP